MAPFKNDAANWKNPKGIVAMGTLKADENEFKINFGDFAPRPNSSQITSQTTSQPFSQNAKSNTADNQQNSNFSIPGAISSGNILGQLGTTTSGGTNKIIISPQQFDVFTADDSLRTVDMAALQQSLAEGGKLRFYVRVIPVVAASDGNYKGYPTDTRAVFYGEPGEGIKVDPAFFTKVNIDINVPEVKIQKYTPIQWEDPNWVYRYVVYKDPSKIPYFNGIFSFTWADLGYYLGQKLDFTPKPQNKSFWDHVGDFFEDVFNFLVDVLSWVSNAWEAIKSVCIDIVASCIPFCDDTCKAALTMALNAGLAVLGIPPTIPNFEQLMDGGVEYIAATIAEETGVPADVVELGLDKMIDEVESAASKNNAPLGLEFIKPDPDFQYKNATLNIVLSNTTNQPTLPGYLCVENGDYLGGKKVYRPISNVPIPSIAPGKSLPIPVYFVENNESRDILFSNPRPLKNHEWAELYHDSRIKVTVYYRPCLDAIDGVEEFKKRWGQDWWYYNNINYIGGPISKTVTYTPKHAHSF